MVARGSSSLPRWQMGTWRGRATGTYRRGESATVRKVLPPIVACSRNVGDKGSGHGKARKFSMCGFVVSHGAIHLLANKSQQYAKYLLIWRGVCTIIHRENSFTTGMLAKEGAGEDDRRSGWGRR